MNHPTSLEVVRGNSLSPDLIGHDEALSRVRKSLSEDVAPPIGLAAGPGMRFAFLIHPLSEQTRNLMALDREGRLRETWGRADLLEFCAEAHAAFGRRHRPIRMDAARNRPANRRHIRRAGLGGRRRAEGRLYEIPMDARSILADPDRAMSSSWSRPSRTPSAGGPGSSDSAR